MSYIDKITKSKFSLKNKNKDQKFLNNMAIVAACQYNIKMQLCLLNQL